MATTAEKPLVFVSYSHRDQEAKGFVDRHLQVLSTAGNIEVWHDGEITVGDDWYQEIETKLNGCAVAVLLISTDFLASEFCMKEEAPILLQRRHREGMMIAPVLLRPCAWQIVPWLRALQMHSATPLLRLSELDQEEELAKVVMAIHGYLEDQAKLVAIAVEQSEATGQRTEIRGNNNTVVQVDGDHVNINIVVGPKPDTTYPALAEGAVDLTHLPTSGYDVVGRDDELRMLDDAFDGDALNIVSLCAWGGVGKSTLVNKWCEYLAADNYRDARRVFAWSFFSQGPSARVTSADAFIDAAFTFFGDGERAEGSPWRRGERLAELVGREKALLILDGMELLQDEHQGIEDPALSRLIECLAEKNAGLCVITTREPVKELSSFSETTREVNLEQLSVEAGRVLLRIKGIRAADALLERASEAFSNHALALDLLASYLKRFEKGDVSQALSIPDLSDVCEDDGRHPRRVMAAYAEKFGGGPELDLLHVMGLFDRPADTGCIASLRKKPAVPGLTEKLSALDETGWRDLLEKLRDLGLLAEASHYAPEELDAHPHIREHFGARLQVGRGEAWKTGHDRLYEYLKTVPDEHRPATLAAMAPLFEAVRHGCLAGRQCEALDAVYKARIIRQNKSYITKELGAFGADLGLLASFFDPPFQQPAEDLVERDRAWLLNQAAFDLRALGRLGEAVVPARASMNTDVRLENWKGAAASAIILLELKLALGDMAAALAAGEAALVYADLGGDDFFRMAARTAFADARLQAGRLDDARNLFEEAEAIQSEWRPSLPKLYSIYCFRYCDLLLTLGRAKAASDRALYSLEISKEHGDLLSVALDHLSLGQTAHALGHQDDARSRLDQAVDGLREAGSVELLARGLLARAAFLRKVKEYALSRRDLTEVMRFATRCGMRLNECDAHLEYARLAIAEGNLDAALHHFKSADVLVAACGYNRRDQEIAELKEQLGH